MEWEPPAYTEINMSSEIGGYQDDFEERGPAPANGPPVVTTIHPPQQPQG